MRQGKNMAMEHYGGLFKAKALTFMLFLGLSACANNDLLEGAPDQLAASPETLQHLDVDSALAQGLRLLSEGKAEEAQKSFSRILKIEPETPKATLGLAESYLSLGQGEAALELFSALEGEAELKTLAIQGQGLAHYRMGNSQLAKEKLSQATTEDNKLWRAWNVLGQLADTEKTWEVADNHYVTAIEQNPRAASPLNNHGMSLLMRGNFPAALARFNESLALNPRSATAQSNRRIALSMMGRYEDALQGVPSEERHIALNNVGYIAMTRGDLKEARYYFNLSAEESPTYYETAEENLNSVEHLLAGSNAANQ
jgi:Flp pilus assembly protein TadD